jgi:hypothetical protein
MRSAFLSLFVIAVPAFAADEDKDYYPLKIGTKWTYKIAGQEDKFVVTAVKEEKVGEQNCVKIEAKLKDQLVASEHVAIRNDGVYRFKFGDQVIEPEICFLKASSKKGDSWKHDFKIGETKATGKYEVDVEDVEVPAGKFKDAIVIRAEATEKDEVTKTTIWYAKKTGMVKQVIEIGAVKIALELEKME